jgi:outer membrane protein W
LKPYAVLRRGIALPCALLAVALFVVPPVSAAPKAARPAKTAKPAKPAKVAKPPRPAAKQSAAAADTAAVARAARRKAEKPQPVKPARPPEKTYAEQRAEDGPWAKRTNWVSVRAGYAKSTAENGGDGLAGYGVAYQHMINSRWSFGGAVQHDLVGHLSNSYEVSVPMTVELARHFRWKSAFHPYVGLGGGYYFHKYYRTGGDDTGAPGAGTYVTLGGNMPVDDRHLIGLDARISFVSGRDGVTNPVFGPEKATETLWSVKLNWALAY